MFVYCFLKYVFVFGHEFFSEIKHPAATLLGTLG